MPNSISQLAHVRKVLLNLSVHQIMTYKIYEYHHVPNPSQATWGQI